MTIKEHLDEATEFKKALLKKLQMCQEQASSIRQTIFQLNNQLHEVEGKISILTELDENNK